MIVPEFSRTSSVHGSVWYPIDFSRGQIIAELPDDLDPRLLPPGSSPHFGSDDPAAVLLLDDPDAGLIEAARRAMVPVVVLSDAPETGMGARGYVSLTLPVSPVTLASVLRAACEQARVTRTARETTRQLEELNAIGVRLSGERDTKLLLDLILTKARTITRSDAGSIYLVEHSSDGSRRLRFELAHNESVPVEFKSVALPINPKSLAGHVALSGEILHVDDAYALPAERTYRFNPEVDALAGYRTKSMLVLPMKTPGGDIIGVLELINCKRESGRAFPSREAIEREALPYSQASRNLAASLASQAAVPLSNRNRFRELTRRQGRLEALVEVSQRVTRLWPPATVQRRIADLYCGLLQAETVAFHLVDEDRLVRTEARGEGVDVLLPAEIAVGEGPCGGVAASGEPLAVPDLAGSAILNPEQAEMATKLGLRAWLSVPVRAGDRLVGVLTAVTSQSSTCSEDDVAVATTFAAQAGIAVENSRLYAELERALEGVQKSQDQLVQVERLRALGEMAAGVAHDFNNLLAIVMLRTELLLARGQAPDVAESLSMIRQAAQDGAQTVRRIQEFTRTRSIRPFAPVDMNRVVREVIDLSRPRWRDQAQSCGVTYDVKLETGRIPLIAGTAEELREAFLNLLKSALGRGTTFVVNLPVPAELPTNGGAGGSTTVPPGKRVLIVEDNPAILQSLGDLLRENGCHVVEAADGLAAISRIEMESVDLVLTDLAMPGASGWEVATACRERFPTTPIGLITGFGDRLEPEKIERHGVQFVVAKPFTSTELLREVSAALTAS